MDELTKSKARFDNSGLWSYLQAMADANASDLFITVGKPPCFKVDGRVVPFSTQPLTSDQVNKLAFATMSLEQGDEFRRELESNFAISRPGIGRFRVNVFRQLNETGLVVRRIKDAIPTLAELGLPASVESLAMAKRGLVIFVGATGVGKSTSLAAMVGHRNRSSEGHIVCVEDPVEFVHHHAGCIVTQREVGIDTHSYEHALQNMLRQAPDVVMIGEVRSRETMEHAITFAETGHLVLTTLHATNTNQALDRILNFFPSDRRQQLLMDLSLNLRAIVGQRLLPAVASNGRKLAVELMLNSPYIADLILRGDIPSIREAMKKSTLQQMCTFDDSIHALYEAGEITAEDAVHYADSPNNLRLMIKLGRRFNPEAELLRGQMVERGDSAARHYPQRHTHS